jgi:succinate-acetate transporter protein
MDIKQTNKKGEKKEKREKEIEIDIKQNGQKTGHKHSKTYKSIGVLEMWSFFFFVLLLCTTSQKLHSPELNFFHWFGLTILFCLTGCIH